MNLSISTLFHLLSNYHAPPYRLYYKFFNLSVSLQNNEVEDYVDVSANFNIEIPQATKELQDDLESFDIFPNPSQGTSHCSIHLLNKSKVELILTDLTGRKIKSIVRKVLDAGTYEFSYTINNLPDGTYIYRLSVNGNIRTHKLNGTSITIAFIYLASMTLHSNKSKGKTLLTLLEKLHRFKYLQNS